MVRVESRVSSEVPPWVGKAATRIATQAARSFGLRTGFIHRPNEYGPMRPTDAAKPGDFDVVAEDMVDLAEKMGA